MSTKEIQWLRELTSNLEQFAEATDITQGDNMVSVSCIVPTILLLAKTLTSKIGQLTTFSVLIKSCFRDFIRNFMIFFANLGIPRPSQIAPLDHACKLKFDDSLLMIAPALDPTFGYHWTQDHPRNMEERQKLRKKN
jgi:hypothetical protein